jgi:hypothetical protein
VTALVYILGGAVLVALIALFRERSIRLHAEERARAELARTWAKEIEREAEAKKQAAKQAAQEAAASVPQQTNQELEKEMNR